VLENLPVRAGLTTASPYVGFTLPPPHPLLAEAYVPRAIGSAQAKTVLRRLGVTHMVWDGPAGLASNDRVLYAGADAALDEVAYSPAGTSRRRVWTIIELPSPLPQALATGHWLLSRDRRQLFNELLEPKSLDAACYLESEAPQEPRTAHAHSAEVRRWTGRTAEVEHDGACDLVIARTFYPGWTARIDDGPARPVFNVNGGLQAVRVDRAGTTRVAFSYRPTGFIASIVLSISSLLAVVIVMSADVLRRRGST
jgi:hypothetical protein